MVFYIVIMEIWVSMWKVNVNEMVYLDIDTRMDSWSQNQQKEIKLIIKIYPTNDI